VAKVMNRLKSLQFEEENSYNNCSFAECTVKEDAISVVGELCGYERGL